MATAHRQAALAVLHRLERGIGRRDFRWGPGGWLAGLRFPPCLAGSGPVGRFVRQFPPGRPGRLSNNEPGWAPCSTGSSVFWPAKLSRRVMGQQLRLALSPVSFYHLARGR